MSSESRRGSFSESLRFFVNRRLDLARPLSCDAILSVGRVHDAVGLRVVEGSEVVAAKCCCAAQRGLNMQKAVLNYFVVDETTAATGSFEDKPSHIERVHRWILIRYADNPTHVQDARTTSSANARAVTPNDWLIRRTCLGNITQQSSFRDIAPRYASSLATVTHSHGFEHDLALMLRLAVVVRHS